MYLTVTFFVVIVLLSGVDVQLDLVWVDVVLHKLFPVVVVLDWLVDPPMVRLTNRDALLWLVYPIVWVVVTLVRGAADGWYPYPFLDPAKGGYGHGRRGRRRASPSGSWCSRPSRQPSAIAWGGARPRPGRGRPDTVPGRLRARGW